MPFEVFSMVEDLTNYLDGFPNSDYFILGGDLNIYTDSEPAFVELTDVTNNITFVDPANRVGSWHNNTTYIDVFTQSTRTQFGLGGATGGNREYVPGLSRAAVSIGAAAIFMEVHPDPDNAKSDGPNSVYLSDLESLLTTLKRLDEVVKS